MFTRQEIKTRLRDIFNEAGSTPEAGYGLACAIAFNALLFQKDKSGKDYAHHLNAVSRYNTMSETKMIIGVLHDLVEDTDWTLDDLREVGFPKEIVDGVDAMTKRPGEAYFDFIVRCGQNEHAIDVKISDLHHNMTLSRNNSLPKTEDFERWSKYLVSYNYLVDIKRGETERGASVAAWMRQQKPELQDWDLLSRHSGAVVDGVPGGTNPVPEP
jgi:(p)ppGpp synthase/HD superfamily hydrolase